MLRVVEKMSSDHYPLFCNGARGRWACSPAVMRGIKLGYWGSATGNQQALELPAILRHQHQRQTVTKIAAPSFPSRYRIFSSIHPRFPCTLIDRICS